MADYGGAGEPLTKERALDATVYLEDRALLLIKEGEILKAIPLLQESFDVRFKHIEHEQPTADTLLLLGDTVRLMGDFRKAEELLNQFLQMQQLLAGKENEKYAKGLHAIAEMRYRREQYRSAGNLHAENTVIRVDCGGDVASTLCAQANNLIAIAKFTEAQECCDKSYAIRSKVHGGMRHTDVAESVATKARLQLALGNAQVALALSDQALGSRRRLLSEAHPIVAESLQLCAECLFQLGRFDDAVSRLDEVIELIESRISRNHALVAIALFWKARCAIVNGQYKSAMAQGEEARAMFLTLRAAGACGSGLVAEADLLIGDVLRHQGKHEEAMQKYKIAIETNEQVYIDVAPPLALTYVSMAENYRFRGYFSESEDWLLKAGDILKATVGKEHPFYATYQQTMGDLRTQQGVYVQVRP